MAPALNAEKGLLALAAAAACCAGCVDAVPTASGSGDTVAATLFACGSHNDVSADTIQIIHVFDAAKSVCCDELHEQCDDSSSTLPTTCRTPGCARVAGVVAHRVHLPLPPTVSSGWHSSHSLTS